MERNEQQRLDQSDQYPSLHDEVHQRTNHRIRAIVR